MDVDEIEYTQEMLDWLLSAGTDFLSEKQYDMLDKMRDQLAEKEWLSDQAREIIEDIAERVAPKIEKKTRPQYR